jgi:hypothetical protein
VLQPLLAKELRQRDYLLTPDVPAWRDVWTKEAPFHLIVSISERYAEDYLQSRNRVSLLNAKLSLLQRGNRCWEQVATARTHVPVPKIPAYQAARLGFGDAPVPEYERVLYNNAWANFQERFPSGLHALPQRATFPGPRS